MLAIAEKLGLQEGMAIDYSNLGWVCKASGDDKTALEYWEKAEELYSKIGMPHKVERVRWLIEGLNRGDEKKRIK